MKRSPICSSLAAFLLVACLSSLAPALAGEKAKEKGRHALLVVSVFTEEGFSLPGVRVSVRRQEDKKPKWEGKSDARGELALRLPPGPAKYEIATHSANHENQTRRIEFFGEERQDAVFRLRAAPTGKRE